MKAAGAAAVAVVVVQEGCSLQQQPVQWLQALRTGLGTGDGKRCFCSAIVSRLACSGCIGAMRHDHDRLMCVRDVDHVGWLVLRLSAGLHAVGAYAS
jgi:hypothetical protein